MSLEADTPRSLERAGRRTGAVWTMPPGNEGKTLDSPGPRTLHPGRSACPEATTGARPSPRIRAGTS